MFVGVNSVTTFQRVPRHIGVPFLSSEETVGTGLCGGQGEEPIARVGADKHLLKRRFCCAERGEFCG